MVLKKLTSLAIVACAAFAGHAQADDATGGKLLLTGGVSEVEGAAGGGLHAVGRDWRLWNRAVPQVSARASARCWVWDLLGPVSHFLSPATRLPAYVLSTVIQSRSFAPGWPQSVNALNFANSTLVCESQSGGLDELKPLISKDH